MKKRYMKKEDFEGLLKSVRQMVDHIQGKPVPGLRITRRTVPATAEEVKALRTEVLEVTQEQFALIVGEGLGAVRTWEQGLRRPSGAASKLMRYMRKHPEAAKDLALA